MPAPKEEYGTVIHELREKLGLTQNEFAETYNIPLSTLRKWEQNSRTPDTAAASYLIIIARHPKLVADELAKLKKSPLR
jgi:putative transcriptional regulator